MCDKQSGRFEGTSTSITASPLCSSTASIAPTIVSRSRSSAGLSLSIRKFFQPLVTNEHLFKLSRNLTSFSKSSRMSSSSYISPHIRSIPKPNANPENSCGSIPTARSTFGCTMPEPPNSIQPEFLQMRQPLPLHLKQLKSNSALGSVNGKYDGRKRVTVSGPKTRRKTPPPCLQVRHRDAAIDTQSFDLEKHRIVRGIGSIATKYATGRDHSDRHARRCIA